MIDTSDLRRFKRPSLGLAPDARWLFYAMLTWEFGYGCYSAIQTLFIKSLGATDLQIGLLIGIQGIIRVAITLPSGILADKFSRRTIMIWSTAAGVPACIVAGLAQTWLQLLPGLILLLVSGVGTPAITAYIAQMSTKENRARNFTFIYTFGSAIGLIVAPALGGFLADRIAMRAVFFASATLYLAATYFFTRVSERPLPQSDHSAPSYREAIGEPVVRRVAMLMFVVLAACTMGVTFLPNYLSEVHGLNVGTIGRLFSVAAMGTVLISQATTKLRWITPVRGIAIGTLGVAIACVTTVATGNLWILAFAFLGRGGFMVAWTMIYVVLGDVDSGPAAGAGVCVLRLPGRHRGWVDAVRGRGGLRLESRCATADSRWPRAAHRCRCHHTRAHAHPSGARGSPPRTRNACPKGSARVADEPQRHLAIPAGNSFHGTTAVRTSATRTPSTALRSPRQRVRTVMHTAEFS